MQEQSTERVVESRPVWESLEAFARQGVQDLLHRMLKEEVAAMLGRRRYARREGVDAGAGYRNGYGKPRRLSLSVGTITLRLGGAASTWLVRSGHGALPAFLLSTAFDVAGLALLIASIVLTTRAVVRRSR